MLTKRKIHSERGTTKGDVTVIHSDTGGTDRIRCPNCNGIAVRQNSASKGASIYKCTGRCGSTFKSQKM